MSYDLEKAAIHIVHDYALLMAGGHDLQSPLPGLCRHYAERTFLVYCRSFAKFFSAENRPGDLYARDFVDVVPSFNHLVWDSWHDHIDKHVMHLTEKRITNERPWTGSDDKTMLDEFERAWLAFYGALKPCLKPIFDKELATQQKNVLHVKLS